MALSQLIRAWSTSLKRAIALQATSSGALHVADSVWQVPRISVTPEVATVAQSFQEFGDGTHDVFYLRYTVNAPDDVAAGSRLFNGYPEVGAIPPDSAVRLSSSAPITRIDVVAFGDDNDGTPAAGEQIEHDTENDDEADVRTAMITFEFNSADDVRWVILTSTPSYSSGTDGLNAANANLVGLLIEGFSDA